MRAGPVAMALLVGADRHLRGVRMERAVGEDDLDVAAAGAARLPFRQRQRAEVGHEVRLPHMLAGPDRQEVAFAGEVALAPDPLRKGARIVEQKPLVAEDIEQERQVVGGNEPHRFGARRVEQAVRRVEGRREQGARSPFEAVRFPLADVDRGAAMAGEHVERLVIEVAQPIGCAAGLDFDHLQADEIATAAQLNERGAAPAAQPGPGLGPDGIEVDGDALDERYGLASRPFAIGVDEITGSLVACHWLHLYRPMRSPDGRPYLFRRRLRNSRLSSDVATRSLISAPVSSADIMT